MNIELNDLVLNYEVEGKGNPLLLLHGNGEDLHIFDKLRSRLSSDFLVYAIDSRNHGLSTHTSNYSYDAFANDIFQFIQKLNLQNVSIVGFSDGAIIALSLALKYPDLLTKMVLLGVNLKPDDFEPEVYKELRDEYEKSQDPLLLLMLQQPNIEIEALSTIEIPTLIVAGENDVFKRDSFFQINEALPNSELIIKANHDHASYIVGQDLLYPDLRAFLFK